MEFFRNYSIISSLHLALPYPQYLSHPPRSPYPNKTMRLLDTFPISYSERSQCNPSRTLNLSRHYSDIIFTIMIYRIAMFVIRIYLIFVKSASVRFNDIESPTHQSTVAKAVGVWYIRRYLVHFQLSLSLKVP